MLCFWYSLRTILFQLAAVLIFSTPMSLFSASTADDFAARAAVPRADLVFDLDGTLIYSTSPEMRDAVPERTFEVDGEVYRFADHAPEVLARLYKIPGVRISFMSGGRKSRNKQILEVLHQAIDKLTGHSRFRPHLVLDVEDLHVVSENLNLKFTERVKKNLKPFFDPRSTVLIDDVKTYAFEGQQRNLLWLGKVYTDRPRYELRHLENKKYAKYSAPDLVAWKMERNKLLTAEEKLITAFRKMQTDGTDLLTALEYGNASITCRALFVKP